MKVEVRNNQVEISGYVNVHTRDSRILPSPRGRFIEQIMPNAFGDALQKATNVELRFNHRADRIIGGTSDGNLTLKEDAIGLHATAIVTDAEIVEKAKRDELRGWSFGFIATEQRWDDGENGIQRRYIDGLILNEVSILDVTPAYVSTTIEARGEESVVTESRFEEFKEFVNNVEERKEDTLVIDANDSNTNVITIDYSDLENYLKIKK